jgi:tetratricopeptide (TPR) repeat protein/predicted Ser/Thr protein kinase
LSSDAEATTAEGTSVEPRRDVDELGRGTALGRYVVLSRLGAGGMGIVYACYDPTLDRRVALKLLFAGDDPRNSGRARTRLVQEAQALARLSHPNVVAVHDVDEVNGRIYLAMEFVEGQTLGEWAKAERRTWAEVLDVYTQAARGLAAAHEVGLVHRDFKPENAMIGVDGRVRVMDFGLARSAEAGVTDTGGDTSGAHSRKGVPRGLTATGAVVGTPAYMAPEQHRGLPADAKADQFSWCVSLHEALYGARPFSAESIAGLAVAVTEGRRAEIADERGVPRWLRKTLERGLSTDPAQRFATMHDLLRALGIGRTRTARRRWTLGLAAIACVGTAALGARELGRRRAIAACEQAGDAIAEVWNDDAREGLKRSLEATGAGHALEAFERAAPRIDAAASSWRSTRQDVCTRAEVERTLDPELHERAIACLDDRKLEIGVMLESAAQADLSTVNRIVVVAAALDPVEPCGDEDALARESAPDPVLRAEVAEIRRELTRARALYTAGRLEPAREVVEAAAERANATDWAPLVVHAALDRATIIEASGRHAEAVESYRTAFERGWAAGLDQEVTEAAQHLASLHANELGQFDEALRWGRLAQLTCQRLGEHARAHEGSVHTAMGVVYSMRGEHAEALVESEAALAVLEETMGPQHPEVASVLTNIGAIEDRLGHGDRARAALDRALRIRESTLGPHHPEVALVLNNIAAVALSAGDLEGAQEAWTRALAIFETSLGPEHLQLSMVLRNLSILHRQKGEIEAAARVAERAYAIRKKALGPDHPMTADTAIGAAWLRSELGDHAAALELLEHAMSVQERTWGPDHADLALVLDRLASVQERLGDLDAARATLHRAIAILEAAAPDGENLRLLRAQLAKIDGRPSQ